MFPAMVFGASRAFSDVLARLDEFARSDWPILIVGETGVGKELAARRVHDTSERRRGPFVPVNCGAIPSGLIESELFGHDRGAFSGAMSPSRGLARAAHGGTLFLDEIGDLDPALQVKLLRFLDSGEVRSVGSTRTERVDVRIVAATNVDLSAAVAQGLFRRDLVERLGVLRVKLPPLRERLDDIPLIAASILQGLGVVVETPVLTCLQGYGWPGNVRQLRNVLVRAAVLGRHRALGSLLARLVDEERLAESGGPLVEVLESGSLADIEKTVIVSRLSRNHGNRKRTARDLGIAKSTLHEKLRRWRAPEVGVGVACGAVAALDFV